MKYDTSVPCRVWCSTHIRVSVRHRHDTRTTFYILNITDIYVSVSCLMSMSVSMLHIIELRKERETERVRGVLS